MKNLEKINFREALKPQDRGATARDLAEMLWYFLRKFDLKYPESVLLDIISFDWIEGDQFVGIDYLENKLPPEKMRERILENLSGRIEVGQVLKNHINYCKKYQIQEAREHLYEIVENPKVEMENRLLALETVTSLPNSTLFIEKMLDTNELKLFSKAAEIVIARNDKKGKEKLVHKLSSQNENFALESSKLLIEEQDLKAVQFYANFIKRTKKFEVDIRGRNPLQKIKAVKALSILFELLKFSYEYEKEIQQEFYTLDSTVIDALKNIALQNYSNFTKVIKRLQKFIKKYHSQFEGMNFLNVVCDDIEKAFFINYTSQITVDEAIDRVWKLCKGKI